jgi:hypothetical protein
MNYTTICYQHSTSHHVVLSNQPGNTACGDTVTDPHRPITHGTRGLPMCSACIHAVRSGLAWLEAQPQQPVLGEGWFLWKQPAAV